MLPLYTAKLFSYLLDIRAQSHVLGDLVITDTQLRLQVSFGQKYGIRQVRELSLQPQVIRLPDPRMQGGWTTKADFELNFPTFNVIGGTTYYLEIGRSSGNGNFYISEASTNPYASGATYHDGVINTNYDIKFQLDITYSTDPVIPISPTISLSGVAQKGISTTITASTSVEGFLNFKVNKKSLPQCQKIRATGSPLTATCSWKPSVKGVALISVYLLPSDTATYQNSAPSAFSVLVSNRTNRR